MASPRVHAFPSPFLMPLVCFRLCVYRIALVICWPLCGWLYLWLRLGCVVRTGFAWGFCVVYSSAWLYALYIAFRLK